jgi:hypothetical protein
MHSKVQEESVNMLEVGTKVILGIKGYKNQKGVITDYTNYVYIVETDEDTYTIPHAKLGTTYSIVETEFTHQPKHIINGLDGKQYARIDTKGNFRKNGKIMIRIK